MRPILTYYGGKQRMAHHIVPIIERIPHKVYVEPFAGGAAILFAKDRPNVTNQHDYREYLNDTNQKIATMYRVCRDPEQRAELLDRLKYTEYGESVRKECKAIYKADNAGDVDTAWAVVTMGKLCFSGQMCSSLSYGKIDVLHPLKFRAFKADLPSILDRLALVYITEWDAIDCINRLDGPDTLFYCDPPYVGAYQGHYAGYTAEQYDELLECLGQIKGRFLLSGYPNEQVPDDWPYVDFKARTSSENGKTRKQDESTVRIERLWSNTPMETLVPESVQLELFA